MSLSRKTSVFGRDSAIRATTAQSIDIAAKVPGFAENCAELRHIPRSASLAETALNSVEPRLAWAQGRKIERVQWGTRRRVDSMQIRFALINVE